MVVNEFIWNKGSACMTIQVSWGTKHFSTEEVVCFMVLTYLEVTTWDEHLY
jgi:hypothetical protein